jgi:flagellar motility protein MotE (MotC chaperone)
VSVNLNTWLRKTPRPTIVLADDKRIEVPKNTHGWRDLTRTLEALKVSKIACLDAAGNVIRAMELDEDDAEKAVKESDSEIQTFARLIAEAYEKGSKATQPLLDNCLQFIERQAQRIQTAEREMEKLRMHNVKLQAEILALSQEPAPAEGDGLLGGLVQGMLAAESESRVPKIVKGGAK